MIAHAPCVRAAADQPPLSSDQKSRATATRSPAAQHPGSQQEPPLKASKRETHLETRTPLRAVEDDHVDRPGVQARQRVELTGTNRSIGLIPLMVHVRGP